MFFRKAASTYPEVFQHSFPKITLKSRACSGRPRAQGINFLVRLKLESKLPKMTFPVFCKAGFLLWQAIQTAVTYDFHAELFSSYPGTKAQKLLVWGTKKKSFSSGLKLEAAAAAADLSDLRDFSEQRQTFVSKNITVSFNLPCPKQKHSMQIWWLFLCRPMTNHPFILLYTQNQKYCPLPTSTAMSPHLSQASLIIFLPRETIYEGNETHFIAHINSLTLYVPVVGNVDNSCLDHRQIRPIPSL